MDFLYHYPALYNYQHPDNLATIKALEAEAKAEGIEENWKVIRWIRKRFNPAVEKADVPDGAIAKQAIADIKELAAQNKPFFLAVWFKRPHLPFVAHSKYWDLYDE